MPPDVASSGRLWISSEALTFISREASDKSPLETGGVLLGYWAGDPPTPVVAQAVGPGPNAIHEAKKFIPDYEYHEREVAQIFNRSDEVLQYLGDWHSHPGASGHLSDADAATLYTIGRDRQAGASRPIMVILAYGPTWAPVAWVGRPVRSLLRKKVVIARLEVLEYDRADTRGRVAQGDCSPRAPTDPDVRN